MSDSMHTPRIVDGLLLLDDVDDDFVDLEVVEDLFSILTEDLEVLADAPSATFLAELLAAVPEPPKPMGRGFRIAVLSGTVLLAAAGAAAANGSLPDPVQSAVHAAAESVGINIPDADAQGPPATGGSQDGAGHGRSDEAPGRPEEPGQPEEPGRADEAPGQPEVPGSIGVGPEGVPPGQVENENPDSTGVEDPNVGGDTNPGADNRTTPATPVPPTTAPTPTIPGNGNANANGGGPANGESRGGAAHAHGHGD